MAAVKLIPGILPPMHLPVVLSVSLLVHFRTLRISPHTRTDPRETLYCAGKRAFDRSKAPVYAGNLAWGAAGSEQALRSRRPLVTHDPRCPCDLCAAKRKK